MKKKYSKPIAATICIATEHMIASSPEVVFTEEKANSNFEVLEKDKGDLQDDASDLW